MEEKFWNVGSVLRIAALVGVIAIIVYQRKKDKENG